MSNPLSDRNLLVGVLALQFGLVTRDQLVDAISAWGSDKARPLDEIFVRQKAITQDHRQRLAELVALHIQLHGGDVEKSLAALSSVAEVRSDLRQVDDSDLEASLLLLQRVTPPTANGSTPPIDPNATISVGVPSSDGARFRILRPHAKGGLGEVSVAFDAELNREVALKEIQRQHADHSHSRSRFLLEAQITGGLEHPGIVPVYGMGTYADGRPFYAMRFIRGDSLKDGTRKFFDKHSRLNHDRKGAALADDDASPTHARLRTPRTTLATDAYKSFDFRELLQRFIDVCNAVAYAHARGVLHRDLKPGNIMLGKYGETLVVDWGLAKVTGKSEESLQTSQAPLSTSPDRGSAETVMGSVFGTTGYMSPEQAAGRVDQFSPATDIYCLGATLYHLLTSRPPHVDNVDGQLLQRIQTGEFASPRAICAAIPSPLNSICLKAMATKPADRYVTALELAADIKHWLADDPVSAHRDSLLVTLQRWARRHRTLVSSAAVLLLATTVAVLIGYVGLKATNTRILREKNKAEQAEKRERAAKAKAEEALRISTRQLAANYFQHGLAEYEAGRRKESLRDLYASITTLPPDEPTGSGYRAVYLDRLFAGGRLIAPPLRHEGVVVSAVFSPDGTMVVTASGDKTARLWNATTGAVVGQPLQHQGNVNTAVFSPDGTSVLTASDDRTARLWDANSGVAVGRPLLHQAAIHSATFSPDGTRVVTASRDKTARLWDAATGTAVGPLLQHRDAVYSAVFSPDGTRVLTASEDKTAQQWDSTTGAAVGKPLPHLDKVLSAVFSPDGTRILTATWETGARLWDATTGVAVGKPLGHGPYLWSAVFSPDGTRVITTSNDTTQFWDAWTGSAVGKPLRNEGSSVRSAVFSPDGTWVVMAKNDNTARLWHVMTGSEVGEFHHDRSVRSAAFSPDGTRVVTTGDLTARIWDATMDPKTSSTTLFANATSAYVATVNIGAAVNVTLQHEGAVNSAVFSSDGTRIVTASKDNTTRLWDSKTGALIGEPLRHEGEVMSAVFSPDGTRVVTASSDKTARLWNGTTGAAVGQPLRHENVVLSAAFSPDGMRIVTAGIGDGRIWDVTTGAVVGAKLKHEGWVLSATFSPDGTRVVTASRDKTARLWDAATGTAAGEPLRHEGEVNSADFSPDGKWIVTASADRTARLWDAATGTAAREPLRHDAMVFSAVFSPDGTRIVTASGDKTAQVWNAITGTAVGEPLRPLRRGDWVRPFAVFSPDGTRVVSVGIGDTAQLWDATTGTARGAPLRHFQAVNRAVFSPDGTRVVTAGDDRTARVWDVSSPASYFERDFDLLKLLHETFTRHSFVALQELEQNAAWQKYRREVIHPRIRPRHESQARRAEVAQEWFAAAVHLEQLVKENLNDEQLKQRLDAAKQKWAEQKAEWERKGREANAAREQLGPKAD